MTTDERLAKVAEVLDRHELLPDSFCGCGYYVAVPSAHRWHVADSFAPLLDEFAVQDKAAALWEAALLIPPTAHFYRLHPRETPRTWLLAAAEHESSRVEPATAPLSDAQPERGGEGQRDGTDAQRGDSAKGEA